MESKKKQFSIIGDSISTLEGFIPPENKTYYRGRIDMNQTWWGKVIECFDGELLVNNSWSGCTVAKLNNSDDIYPSACSTKRTSNLHKGNITPDIIMVYVGYNDWAINCGMDEKDENYEAFYYAYNRMIVYIKSNYKNADIWCLTINKTCMKQNPLFKFDNIEKKHHIEEYNDVIRQVSKDNNCVLIDLYKYGEPYDTLDYSHPSKDGMMTLAQNVIGIAAKRLDK